MGYSPLQGSGRVQRASVSWLALFTHSSRVLNVAPTYTHTAHSMAHNSPTSQPTTRLQVGPQLGLQVSPQVGSQHGPQLGPQVGPQLGLQLGPQHGVNTIISDVAHFLSPRHAV